MTMYDVKGVARSDKLKGNYHLMLQVPSVQWGVLASFNSNCFGFKATTLKFLFTLSALISIFFPATAGSFFQGKLTLYYLPSTIQQTDTVRDWKEPINSYLF